MTFPTRRCALFGSLESSIQFPVPSSQYPDDGGGGGEKFTNSVASLDKRTFPVS